MCKTVVLSIVTSMLMLQSAAAGVIDGFAIQFQRGMRWNDMATKITNGLKGSFDDIWFEEGVIIFRKAFRPGTTSEIDSFRVKLIKTSEESRETFYHVVVTTNYEFQSMATKAPQLRALIQKGIRNSGLSQEFTSFGGNFESLTMSLRDTSNNVKVVRFVEEMAALGERVKTEGLAAVLAH